jgi:phosphate:Na+ symporter
MGVLTGVGVTALIQSSSATTVMVVSFVNAGLMTLRQAIGVIMGANIGTTVTAWIISLIGFKVSISALSLPLLAIALPLFFVGKGKAKNWGEFIFGFAFLFMGLNLLSVAAESLNIGTLMADWLSHLPCDRFWTIPLFVLMGALLTMLMQSSSASMAVTLMLFGMDIPGFGFAQAAALAMGQNIGTTITANLAAMVANTEGKRAARAHLVFNVVGVIITLIVFRPVLNLIANMTVEMVGSNPYTAVGAEGYSPTAIPMALSLFHTFFNVACTLVLAWFIPTIVKMVVWMVPEKPEEEEYKFRLKYIGGHWMNTAELNMEAAKKEIEEFSKRVLRMYTFLPGLRTAKDDEEFEQLVERVEKYEELTDRMEMEIANFLTKISEGDLSHEGSQRISAMLRVVDNLESIGDSIYQIAVTRKNKREAEVHFDAHLNDNLEQMKQLVQRALDVMDANLRGDYEHVDMASANAAEEAINECRNRLRNEHLEALKDGKYDYAIGTAYSSLYALYEKTGDYIINVSEAIGVKFAD